MKLIDADKISKLGLTIAISEKTGDVLKGHARGKEEVIRRAVDVFSQVLFQAPTIDQWHYPSKGEYPSLLEYVLCKLADDTYEVGYYQGQIDGEPEWAFTCFPDDVVAWQYIYSPKEEE